jgi:hypothetical protein
VSSVYDQSRPVRQVRIFDVEEFRGIGRPGVLGKAIKKFGKLKMHKGSKKFKFPERGLKIVKSSDITVKTARVPYA